MFTIFFSLFLASSFALNNSLIIDIDGGFDDLIAIVLPIINDPANVKAITIQSGSGSVQPTLWSVKKIIELLKPADKPEILVGYSTVEGKNPFPKDEVDYSYTLARLPVWADEASLQDSSLLTSTPSALSVLTKVLEESTNAVDILVLGPSTNVAELLTQKPNLKQKISRVIIVGGALNSTGNVNWKKGGPEWNIYNDPSAFETVLKSAVKITLIPLDVTKDVALSHQTSLLKKIEKQSGKGKQFDIIHGIFEAVKKTLSDKNLDKNKNKIFLSDVLGVISVLNPSLVLPEPVYINVDVEGDTEGKISESNENNGYLVNVAKQLDRSVFHKSFIDILNNRPLTPRRPPLTPEQQQKQKEEREKRAQEQRLKREQKKKEQQDL